MKNNLLFFIQAYFTIIMSLSTSIRRLIKSPPFNRVATLKMKSDHFSLMINTPIIIRGLEDIVNKYDIFLLGTLKYYLI